MPYPFHLYHQFFYDKILGRYYVDIGSVALLSHNSLKWSAILGLSFFCAMMVAHGIHATGFKRTY